MTMTVAEYLTRSMKAAGIERVWGVVGDSLNAFTDALRVTDGLEWMHVRHEEAGAYAAGAEAQLTGRLAACAGSAGPGNLHLINGLYDAHRSRAPVLAIAAHIPQAEIGSHYHQETRPEALYEQCSHFCELVSLPAQLPHLLNVAMRTALAEGGVAVLVIPGDVLVEELPHDVPIHWAPPAASLTVPSEADLDRLARMLNGSARVTILAGSGCAAAVDRVKALAETLKAPIVHALRGKEWLEHDNPFDVGMTGFLGFSSGYEAMCAADTVLVIGSDFPYRAFFPEGARIVQIDIRPEVLGRRAPIEMGLIGDVGATLDRLLPRLEAKSDPAFLDKAKRHYAEARKNLDELAVGRSGHPIHPQYVTKLVSEIAAPDAIFSADTGECVVWAARYLRLGGGRRLLGSFIHASMANAMPQAIGAQAAFPGRQVISLSGDGGFAMLMGDLLSLRQLQLPVKIVIYNNGYLGFVDIEMKAAGYLNFGTDLDNPNFAAMAEAAGIKGYRLEDPGDVEPALREGLAHDGPVVFDVKTNPLELVMPPHIERKQALGFSVYSLKAFLDGRGKELVALARTNVLR